MAREIKSAVLHEKFGEHSTLILVDEDYNIHTMTAGDDTFHFLLADVELPNFIHRRVSGGSVYEANRRNYVGYYHASEGLRLISEYRESQKVSRKTNPEYPQEVWCEENTDAPWLEVGKVYAVASNYDDPSVPEDCYRVKTDDDWGRIASTYLFRSLRTGRSEKEYRERFFKTNTA